MKIKLNVDPTHYDEIKKILEEKGFELDENASYVLSENKIQYLNVKDEKQNKTNIAIHDIVYIESYGHELKVYTSNNVYKSNDRLYQVLEKLESHQFIRISNSVIIARNKIKYIKPTFSMKFILTMSNGNQVDVTRTYYYMFKEEFNI
jgi:DNA-binding LytR/AlgR family response regulator